MLGGSGESDDGAGPRDVKATRGLVLCTARSALRRRRPSQLHLCAPRPALPPCLSPRFAGYLAHFVCHESIPTASLHASVVMSLDLGGGTGVENPHMPRRAPPWPLLLRAVLAISLRASALVSC